MQGLKRIDFTLDGRKFTTYYNEVGDIHGIYDWLLDRFLNENKETNERERPNVWIAAYTMLDT